MRAPGGGEASDGPAAEGRGRSGEPRSAGAPGGPETAPPPAGEVVGNEDVETGFYPGDLRRVLGLTAHETAYREVSSWPGYGPTPLRRLDGLARRAGVAELWYKDEAGRFGLGSFKALGGAYGVFRVLEARVRAAVEEGDVRPVDGTGRLPRRTGRGRVPGRPRGEGRRLSPGRELVVSSEQLRAGGYRELVSGVTVSTASAGNHGRSVAWGAEQFGCGCVVYLPAGAADARVRAIEGHGARVVPVEGDYERALSRASEEARREGRVLVPDTAYDGHTDVPRVVMQGYTILVREALRQLPSGSRPTHVFLQAGVGGLAAAVTGHLWEAMGPDRPRIAVVEAEGADCLRRGILEGRRVTLEEVPATRMTGMACRAPSRVAWPVLRRGAHCFLAIPDAASSSAVRALSEPAGDDPRVTASPSGAAGLGGLLSSLRRPSAREALALGPEARVMVVGTEGVGDPEAYREITGRTPAGP